MITHLTEIPVPAYPHMPITLWKRIQCCTGMAIPYPYPYPCIPMTENTRCYLYPCCALCITVNEAVCGAVLFASGFPVIVLLSDNGNIAILAVMAAVLKAVITAFTVAIFILSAFSRYFFLLLHLPFLALALVELCIYSRAI